jgi:hypothetical protein
LDENGQPEYLTKGIGWKTPPTIGTVWPMVSGRLDIQFRYEMMRQAGESHNMAEMLATRSFPGLKTDSIFNEGRCNGNQFESCPQRGDWLREQAEAAGVSTTGKYHCSGLARFPGDPKAWVNDRADVLRVARENGMNVRGYVDYEAPEVEPTPDIPIADDLVQSEVDDIMDCNPGLRRGDVEEKVRELRTGVVDPNPLCVSDPVYDF